ncbi:MAG: AMP-binding protein, partial [Clostridia bacterium]|nr:AMP-binding protein [Clostridia bacterium]
VGDVEREVLFYAGKYQKNIEQIKKELPKIKYFIGFDLEEDNGNELSFNKLKNNGKELYENGNEEFTKIEYNENDLKMIVYTSGTTGLAKGVMLSEHNLLSVVYYGLQVATVYDSCLSVLPYHHTYEAVAGILVELHNHSTICINDSLKNVLPNIQLFKPEHIYLVPAFAEVFYKKIWSTVRSQNKEKLVKTMIKISNGLRKIHIDLRKILFKSITKAFGGNLKEIIVGGAPLRSEIGDFFDAIGIDLLNGYGITECSPLVSVNRPKFNDPATVGVILPCCEVKIIDSTDEGIGEICVKGDIVMKGYYKDEERTKEVLSEDGWFKTGDYGFVNEKGQLVITGRKKNIIVLKNGKNVYPEEIENYILGIPYVQEVIVKESKKGNNLCAEVFLNEEGITKEKLKEDIAEVTKELPVYKHIAEVEIRKEEFIKTTTNKIRR